MRRSPSAGPPRHTPGTGTTPPRRARPSFALALLLTLLAGTPASAQSAWAYLTADPTVFQSGQSIALTAQFYADVDYEYSPWYYPIVGWEVWLETYGSNQFVSPSAAYDEWLNECFYYGGPSCEGGGQPYRNPWLLLPEFDHGPGQTMAATEYITNGVATYYVAFCVEGACWDVPMPSVGDSWYAAVMPQQQPPPALRLFLDVDNNFQQPSDDDLPQFVPGANPDGTSVSIQPEGTPLQQVRLIAAFVNASGQIVAPPVAQVTFTLAETSAFPGYAMNAGTSTAPDFAFVPAQPSVDAGFSGNLSWANVAVFDYAGITTARVSADGFTPFEIRIPRDNNSGVANGMADGGWRAYGNQAHPPLQVADCAPADCQWHDSDGTPTGSGPPTSYGTVGDGLTTWEEYRGFVVKGMHTRTHPGYKDLFVSNVVTATNLDAPTALEYAKWNLLGNTATMTEIGVRLHLVWGQDDITIPPGEFIEYKIDPGAGPHDPEQRRINFNGPDQPVLLSQKAVRIRADPLPMGKVGDWIGICWQPAGPGTGGGVPYNTREVIVDVVQHQGNYHELKRTIAHELGHAINIMHRGGTSPDSCPDGATVGSSTSVMSPFTGASGNVFSPDAQFNADDVPQIRIRWVP